MLFNRIKRAIDRYHLLEKGERLIVGVSAGVDSMVLLHLLNGFRQEFELSLIIAHIHHGLRPVESEREAELVQQVSVRLGLRDKVSSQSPTARSRGSGNTPTSRDCSPR